MRTLAGSVQRSRQQVDAPKVSLARTAKPSMALRRKAGNAIGEVGSVATIRPEAAAGAGCSRRRRAGVDPQPDRARPALSLTVEGAASALPGGLLVTRFRDPAPRRPFHPGPAPARRDAYRIQLNRNAHSADQVGAMTRDAHLTGMHPAVERRRRDGVRQAACRVDELPPSRPSNPPMPACPRTCATQRARYGLFSPATARYRPARSISHNVRTKPPGRDSRALDQFLVPRTSISTRHIELSRSVQPYHGRCNLPGPADEISEVEPPKAENTVWAELAVRVRASTTGPGMHIADPTMAASGGG